MTPPQNGGKLTEGEAPWETIPSEAWFTRRSRWRDTLGRPCRPIGEFRSSSSVLTSAQPWAFMGTPTWMVSHTHIDHIIALPVYVVRRRMMKMEPPTIYLPESAVEPIQKILHQVSRLDRGRLPCTLVPTRPGDEIELFVSSSLRSRQRITPCRRWDS